MSDVFLSAGLHVDPAAIAAKLAWMPYTQTWSGSTDGLVWAVGRVDDPVLWGPAYDRTSRTRVLLGGRAAFEATEWAAAERLPYEGGLAAKLILSKSLAEGPCGIENLNGAALVVIIDERTHEAHVWTDRMGAFPAFLWSDNGFVMCSHPDVVAYVLASNGRGCDFDPITMAEFLRTGTSTHPHSYWQGIEQLDAGTRHRFVYGAKPRLAKHRIYWRPAYFEGEPPFNRRELVARLADALRTAVKRRTQTRLGSVTVMLSAGADSRLAAFATCQPAKTMCYTLYDEPNAELDGARRLATAAGVSHIALQRDPEYYIQNAADAVRLSGGMWNIDSAHFVGIVNAIRVGNPGVLLVGDYADYLFKGLALNRHYRKFFGRALPLFRQSNYRHEFYLPFCQIATEWAKRVEERLEARFSHYVRSDIRRTEYFRLAPLSREGDAVTDLCLWRQFPFDPMMLDRDLLDVYGRMAVEDKLSGIAYGMAVAKVVGAAGLTVPNNNYGAPVDAGEFGRVAAFLLASMRRKLTRVRQPFELDPSSVATLGAWPYFPRIVERSARLRDWLDNLVIDGADLLFDMVGKERRDWSLSDWARHDLTLLVRMFTASLWLSQNAAKMQQITTVPRFAQRGSKFQAEPTHRE